MKPILVTGANKGIGLATVKAILNDRKDTFVFLCSRNLERGKKAIHSLIQEQSDWKSRLKLIQLDVTNQEDISKAVEIVLNYCKLLNTSLYGIVNNAGIAASELKPSDIISVNTFAPIRIMDAFISLLNPTNGRIVNVSSGAAPMFVMGCNPEHKRILSQPKTLDEVNKLIDHYLISFPEKPIITRLNIAYGFSKACLSAFTVLYAKKHPNLKINACSPGYIATDLTLPKECDKTPAEMGMKTTEESTVSIMYLLMNNFKGNGYYFGSDALRSPLDTYRSPGSPAYCPK